MSEILRLRLARAPQRTFARDVLVADAPYLPVAQNFAVGPNPPKASKKGTKAQETKKASRSLLDTLSAQPKNLRALLVAFIDGRRFVGGGNAIAVPLREFDIWLVAADNHAQPSRVVTAFEKLCGKTLSALVSSKTWREEREKVVDSLIASCLMPSLPSSVRGELTRLLLVAGMVELLALTPSPLATEDDIAAALRGRTLALPKDILKLLPRRARLARRYGFSDLFVVRTEWNRYEAGEVAHIENVLAKETKKRTISQLSETEVIDTSETERITTDEHDSQTTDRMELQQHSQSETDLAAHIDGQVDTDGQYGPTKVTTHIGGSFDYSHKDAQDQAVKQIQEAVTRSVKKVEERVKTSRSVRSLQRTEKKDVHSITNDNSQNVVGVYRWVDKIERLQMFRYPHRFLLEFQVPEPATFLSWRRKQPRTDFLTPEPVSLVRRNADHTPALDANKNEQPLEPRDITEATYQWWVAQYNVRGLDAPPPKLVSKMASMQLKVQADPQAKTTVASLEDLTWYDLVTTDGPADQSGIEIPQGYRLATWAASAITHRTALPPAAGVYDPSLLIMVGTRTEKFYDDPVFQLGGSHVFRTALVTIPDTEVINGNVQATLLATITREVRLHLPMTFERLPEGLVRWQQQAYDLIASAYWAIRRQHEDEKAAQSIGAGIAIAGDPPARNQEVVVEELKRGVIGMLTGDQALAFNGRNAMKASPGGALQVDLDLASQYAAEIQFLEQAFEWENMTYVLYPYYWADGWRWPQLADITLADPDFARFLRSGSARVVVPARPGFEDYVRMYVDFGVIWSGGPVPTVDDPDYLSIADEIRSQRQPLNDGEKGKSWEVRLPTTLVWLDNDSTLPKVNPSPSLDAPPTP